VELRLEPATPKGQLFWLPAWIPGSYLIREFAKNIVRIEASTEAGPIAVEKVDKDRFRTAPAEGPLTLRYEVYAWDLSVRTAHLDQTHGFYNATSLCLAAEGYESGAHRVTICAPEDPQCANWQVATTLPRLDGDQLGFGVFEASNYDELIDHPVEMGTFTHFTFEAAGVSHEVAITGRHSCDAERLSRDLKVICESHINMFGSPPPMDRYLFMVMAVGSGYGGLEHRSSTALICDRDDLPQRGVSEVTSGYRQFLGLCSHEYFHLWNVKRIKPAAFTPFRLNEESYTELLWAFEGITSYYDDLGLIRSGLIDAKSYLELVGRTASRVYAGSGRTKQSLAASSFDAWTKFYRQDENAPNAIVSYYAKGALAALAIDLYIVRVTDGAKSLDDVMRLLWTRHGQTGVGVPERGIEALVNEVTGEDCTDFVTPFLYETEDAPIEDLLADVGVRVVFRPAESDGDRGGTAGKWAEADVARAGDLGVKTKSLGAGVKLTHVLDGGAARAAGLSAGDVVVAMDGLRVTGGQLTARARSMGPGTSVEMHAFRRDELMTFTVQLQSPPHDRVYLRLDDSADADCLKRRESWLSTRED
jgi:predicted metalloprotease with PDZ domain